MAFSYSTRIVINESFCGASDSTNFPMFFSGTYPFLKHVDNGGYVTNTNGYDIQFFSDAALSSKLNWDVEKYVAATGQLIVWIKIPTLSSSVDTPIYMAYGDASVSTDQSSASSTWSANYKAVYHLGDGTTLSFTDSSGNPNTLTNHSAAAGIAPPMHCGGAAFVSASSQYLSAADHSSLALGTGPATISMWVRGNTIVNNSSGFFSKDNWPTTVVGVVLNVSGSSKLNAEFRGTGGDLQSLGATTMVQDKWYYVVGVRDGNSPAICRAYLNGVQDGTSTEAGSNNLTSTAALTIGVLNPNSLTQYFNGYIDEFRFVNTNRSPDWILAEYNNQSNPAAFYRVEANSNFGGGRLRQAGIGAGMSRSEIN